MYIASILLNYWLKKSIIQSGPEPKNLYYSDIGTLFPFNNHTKIQTRDSLVDIQEYIIHILFTLPLPV